MPQKEDRRVRKTKKAMTEALAELMIDKPLSSISVREISELADINRGTFYLHYRDVYDMVETLQKEIFDRFDEIVDKHIGMKSPHELFPLLVELYNLLAENAKLAKVLMGKNGDAGFLDKLKEVIQEKCFADIQSRIKTKNISEYKYLCDYIVYGCIGICSMWLKGGMRETPNEMAELTERIILAGNAGYDAE